MYMYTYMYMYIHLHILTISILPFTMYIYLFTCTCIYMYVNRFYQTLKLWIQEPRLHEETLFLPGLPQQYDPDRLALVFLTKQVCLVPHLSVYNCSSIYYTYTCTCIYPSILPFTYTCTCTCTCMYPSILLFTYICVCSVVYTCTCACM